MCLPSRENESGVRFRMAMSLVLRLGRSAVRTWEDSDVEDVGAKRVRGVRGEMGRAEGGTSESWTEKSTRIDG